MTTKEEAVKIIPCEYPAPPGSTRMDMKHWPDGNFLKKYVEEYSFEHGDNNEDETTSSSNSNNNNNLTDRSAYYWQASARLALLRKCVPSHLPKSLQTPNPRPNKGGGGGGGSAGESLTQHDIETIQSIWDKLLAGDVAPVNDAMTTTTCSKDLYEMFTASIQGDNDSGSNNGNGSSSSSNNNNDDIVLSNQRRLQWSIMDCKAACRFHLHAHPNLELIYCITGELHEIRMDGEPLPRSDMTPVVKEQQQHDQEQEEESTSTTPAEVVLQAPNLSTRPPRSWHFATLQAGQWLVNEVGSVHQSFTATSGNGCKLLVLWGGSHANVPDGQEPSVVPKALNAMDDKITKLNATTAAAAAAAASSCCRSNDGNWEVLAETFLPESEKRRN